VKGPPSLLSLTALLGVLVLTISVGTYSFGQWPACEVAPPLADTNGASWPPGTTVTVVINSNQFNATEIQAIQQAFITWQNANTASGVTFTFTTA